MHELSLSYQRILKNKVIQTMYFATSMRMLVSSLVGIFIPIYLFKLNFLFQEIALFNILMHTGRLLLQVPVSYMVAKIGAFKVMAIGFVLQIFNFSLFYLLPQIPELYWALVIVGAFAVNCYFTPLHADFSKGQDKTADGEEIGILNILASLFAAIGPAVGGFIATNAGINYVFVIAIVLSLAAAAILFKATDITGGKEFTMRNFNIGSIKSFLVANAILAIDGAIVGVLWPFAVFLLVNTYASVGFVISAGLTVTLVMNWFVGVRVHKHNEKFFRFGLWSSTVTHLMRLGATTTAAVVGVNLLSAVAHCFSGVTWQERFYEYAARKRRSLEYITVGEMAVQGGVIAFWVVVLFVSFISMERAIAIGFILGALIMPFALLFKYNWRRS